MRNVRWDQFLFHTFRMLLFIPLPFILKQMIQSPILKELLER